MALTKEELLERRGYIGSSDVPALLGVGGYDALIDLWMHKTGRTDPKPTTSRQADFGERVEPVLVKLAADMLDDPNVEYNVRRTHPDYPYMSAQADGWLPDRRAVIESKAYGLWNPVYSEPWGDEWTDQVPYSVMAQVVYSMHVHDAEVGYVTALVGSGIGHRVYELQRSQALMDEIVDRAHAFWNDHVLADVQPEGIPRMDTLVQMIRTPDKTVEIDHSYPERYRSLLDQAKLISDAKEMLKAEIIHSMGDAEQGYTPYGSFTYLPNRHGTRTFRFKEAS